MPPSFLWGIGDGKTYTVRDRLMVIAYQHYVDTLCGGCGQSRIVTTDGDYEGYFRADDQAVTCLACASRERMDAKHEKAKTELPPGRKVVVDFVLKPPEEVPPDGRSPGAVRPDGGDERLRRPDEDLREGRRRAGRET